MKATIWSTSKELRPGLVVTLRRVKNYTATVSHKDDEGKEIIDKLGKDGAYRTELECLGKTLTVAPLKLEPAADWLLDQWVKQLDHVLQKYDTEEVALSPKTINDPDSLVRAILTSTKYKEGQQTNDRR